MELTVPTEFTTWKPKKAKPTTSRMVRIWFKRPMAPGHHYPIKQQRRIEAL